MGNMEYYSKEGFEKMQKQIDAADESMTETIFRLGSGNFATYLNDSFYPHSGFSEAMSRLKELKTRITALSDAMTEVASLREQAEQSAAAGVAGIGALGAIYGTGSFGSVYQQSVSSGTDYSSSKAYWAEMNGYSFTTEYNDLYQFLQTREYKSAVNWTMASEFSNEELYYQFLSGNLDTYTDSLLEESLEGILTTLPGYSELDSSGVDELDWNKIGEYYGCPLLKEKIGALNTLLKETNESGYIGKEIEELLDWFDMMFEDCPEAAGFLRKWVRGVQSGTVGASSAVKGFSDGVEYFTLGSKIVYHMLSNHAQQVEYLENVQEALIQAGYSHGNVIKKIDELKQLYSDEEAYAWHEMEQFALGKINDESASLFDLIPALKNVKFASKVVSTASKVAKGDEIKEVKALMGYQQYDQVLTQTYDKYVTLMKEGVASQADIEKADSIFELLKATKIKEYTAMMNICEGKNLEIYNLAKAKLERLNGMEMKKSMESAAETVGDILNSAS